MEKEDHDAQIMEQCGDSSDDEDDEHFPVLGEWREEGFGNPVVQDIRSYGGQVLSLEDLSRLLRLVCGMSPPKIHTNLQKFGIDLLITSVSSG